MSYKPSGYNSLQIFNSVPPCENFQRGKQALQQSSLSAFVGHGALGDEGLAGFIYDLDIGESGIRQEGFNFFRGVIAEHILAEGQVLHLILISESDHQFPACFYHSEYFLKSFIWIFPKVNCI